MAKSKSKASPAVNGAGAILKEIRTDLENNRVKDALDKIRFFLEKIKVKENIRSSLEASYNEWVHQSHSGTEDPAKLDFMLNALNLRILDFYSDLEEEVKEFVSNTPKEIKISRASFQRQLAFKLRRLYEIDEQPLANWGTFGTYIIYGGREISTNRKKRIAIRALKNQDFVGVEENVSFPLKSKGPRHIDAETINKEIEKVLELKHRNLIKVLGVFFRDFPACYSEEFISGPTLNKLIRICKWPEKEVITTIAQLADALYYLHSKKIIHKKIRPSKVFLDSEGVPVISPFEVFSYSFKMASISNFRKEFIYLSPEQLLEKEPNEKSDQFALGLLMYELLKGAPLFHGKTITEVAELRQKFFKNTRFRNSLIKELNISKGLSDILKRMLQENPEKRYPNLKKVKRSLLKLDLKWSPEVLTVRDSYHRAMAANPGLTEAFYRLLLNNSDKDNLKVQTEVIEIFEGHHQKYRKGEGNRVSEQQERMLRSVIPLLITDLNGDGMLQAISGSSRISAHETLKIRHFEYFLKVIVQIVERNDFLWRSNSGIKEAWEHVTQKALQVIGENLK